MVPFSRRWDETLRRVKALISKFRSLGAIVFVGLGMAAITLVIQTILSTHLNPSDRGVVAIFLELGVLLSIILRRGQEEPVLRTVVIQNEVKYVAALSRLGESGPYLFAGLATGVLFLALGQTLTGVFIACLVGFLVFDVALYASRIHAISGFPGVFVGLSLGSAVPLVALGVLTSLGMGFGLLPWLMAYALPGIAVAWFHRSHAKKKGWADFWEGKEAIKLDFQRSGWTLLPGQLSSFFALRLERFVLPVVSGTESLGLYSAVGGLMDGIVSPLRTWVDFSLSRWAKKQGPEVGLKFWGRSISLTATLLVAVVPLVFLAHFLIETVFPPQYSPAYPLVIPLALSSVLVGTYLFHRGNLVARGRFVAARNGDILLLVFLLFSFLTSLIWGGLGALAWSRVVVFGLAALISGIALAVSHRR